MSSGVEKKNGNSACKLKRKPEGKKKQLGGQKCNAEKKNSDGKRNWNSNENF